MDRPRRGVSAETRITARDGSERLVRSWPATDPVAHLLLVHGLGEHSGRYMAVGERLASAGIDVTAFDQRGFGASDGRRADIESWSLFHEDVEDRLAAIRAVADGLPVVLYGHSLGGLVALGYVLTPRPKPDLLVLSSPGIAVEVPAWKRLLAEVGGRFAPTLRVPNGIPADALAGDPAVARAYLTDPLCVHRSTLRLARNGFREQRRVREALHRLDVSTYVFHGDADTMVPAASSEPLAGVPGVERVLVPGGRHETHNEMDGAEVIDAVAGWIRRSVARLAADR
jgi:alpha-beta hydrolase superfamily lysophospholipase